MNNIQLAAMLAGAYIGSSLLTMLFLGEFNLNIRSRLWNASVRVFWWYMNQVIKLEDACISIWNFLSSKKTVFLGAINVTNLSKNKQGQEENVSFTRSEEQVDG